MTDAQYREAELLANVLDKQQPQTMNEALMQIRGLKKLLAQYRAIVAGQVALRQRKHLRAA